MNDETIAAILASIINEYRRRGDAYAVNTLSDIIVNELEIMTVEDFNEIMSVDVPPVADETLPPDRGIAADVITARLTILRAVDGHDADLVTAAALLQRVIDRLENEGQ